MKKKTKAPRSVLSKQRKRSRTRRRWLNARNIAICGTALGITLISLVVWYSYQERNQPSLHPTKLENIEWQIVLHTSEQVKLTPESKQRLRNRIAKKVGGGSQAELAATARSEQIRLRLAALSLVRTGAHRIDAVLKQLQPAARVRVKKELALLSPGGEVFGYADDTHNELPLITGVIKRERRKHTLRRNHSLRLEHETKKLLLEALELLATATKEGFFIKDIHYVRFRGFDVRMKEQNYIASIGRMPFQNRLTQLRKILHGMKKSGRKAERIELDYAGKAFIKEKTL